MSLSKAKIALVFDWMTVRGGAEKVNHQLHKIFKDAPIYCSIFDKSRHQEFLDAEIHTSLIDKLPFSKDKHQLYLSLMPQAYESFDLSEFDIVISSSHSCAKGIITKPSTLHISYCHSPMRYAWDNWQEYIQNYSTNRIVKSIAKRKMHKIRMWDRLSAERVDYFIANSRTTKRRIEKYYNKPATIIHPSIDCSKYKLAEKSKGYFLAVGRLTPYKKFDLIIETFNKIGLPLKIVGTGSDEDRLKGMAMGNIEFLGYTEDKELKKLYSECEALIFPQVEDFGLTPLECMASGRPVIALREGGALDTVVEDKTGVFFNKQNPEQLKKAIKYFQENKRKFKKSQIREHAEEFDKSQFKKEMIKYINNKWKHWQEFRR
jgi:glycosyltransferase involved in cell wall biosynthesis